MAAAARVATSMVQVEEVSQNLDRVRRQACHLEYEYECLQLGVPDREVEDVHDPSVSSKSIPMSSSTLPDKDHDVVLETVVDCAFMEPSLFLSEGVISSEDEPLVLLIDDLSVMCIPDPPSFRRSLEKILLFEFDGSHKGKFGIKIERSMYAREEFLSSRQRLLKDGWLELWTIHFGRYKLLRDPG